MHELGIVVHVIDQVEEAARENQVDRVTRVVLEVGEVSSIVPEYFTDCFQWAKKRTEHLKDAELELILLEGVSYCRGCRETYKTVEFGRQCPHCGSWDTYLLTGDEITIKEIEAEGP